MSIISAADTGSADLPEVANSLRLDGTNDHLARTLTAGDQQKFTWSGWVKRSTLSYDWATLMASGSEFLWFDATDKLQWWQAGIGARVQTSGVFRDVTGHLHVVIAVDTTQVNAIDRFKIWINGIAQTVTNPVATAQNTSLPFNTASTHYLGCYAAGYYWFSGYLSNVCFIGGQAKTASDFGYTDPNGQWRSLSKAALTTLASAGGTNSFFLPFDNGSSTTTLGYDASSKGNNWTLNNMVRASGATDCWSLDTPTNNFATLNPLYTGRSTISNGALTASGTTDLPTILPDSGTWYFEISGVSKTWTPPAAFPSAAGDYNFGQRAFANAATNPTLCTKNLPVPTGAAAEPAKHFDISLFTGTGGVQNITNSGGFKPDFVWEKTRSATASNVLVDSVRGATKELYTNATTAETTQANGITGFLSNGFSVGSAYAANTHVGWQWKAGGAAVTNNAGSISSQVSANTAAGFSIVTYTGTGANATVGHGLGVAPKMVIVKQRTAASTTDWLVGHTSLDAAAWTTNYAILLNSTAGRTGAYSAWGNPSGVAPTSSVFTVGTDARCNTASGTYVAYCFAEVKNYSAFSSYVGNATTDNAFVWTGFTPAFVMIKCSSTTGNWVMIDNIRQTYNVQGPTLLSNTTDIEATNTYVDFLSNGFKIRSSGADIGAAQTYIYAAFAKNPFQYSGAN